MFRALGQITGENMVVNSLFLAAIALASPGTAKEAGYSKAQLENFRAVSEIAKQTCTAPQTVGYTMNANGSAVVSFTPDKLISRFVAFGGKLGAGGSYARWSGPLQRDVGAALAARSNCQQTVFAAMVNRLPLADPSSGRLIPKPSRPLVVFKKVQASAVPASTPAISNTGNNSGQQINSTAPATINAPNGPVTSGPGTAIQNNYFGAPVTADQKQHARDALLVNLRELAHYPERDEVAPGKAAVLMLFAQKAPRALYLLLSKYDRDTISGIPHGNDLNKYESDYYDFETSSYFLEKQAITHIGTLVESRENFAWSQCYHYALLRAAGMTADSIKGSWGGMYTGMTDAEIERVFNALMKDQNYGPAIRKSAAGISSFTERAQNILKLFDT